MDRQFLNMLKDTYDLALEVGFDEETAKEIMFNQQKWILIGAVSGQAERLADAEEETDLGEMPGKGDIINLYNRRK